MYFRKRFFLILLLLIWPISFGFEISKEITEKQSIDTHEIELVDWTTEVNEENIHDFYYWKMDPRVEYDFTVQSLGVSVNKPLDEQEWLLWLSQIFPWQEYSDEECYKYLRLGFFEKEYNLGEESKVVSHETGTYDYKADGFVEISQEEATKIYDFTIKVKPRENVPRQNEMYFDDLWVGIVPDERVENNPFKGYAMYCSEDPRYDHLLRKSIDFDEVKINERELMTSLEWAFSVITGTDNNTYFGKDIIYGEPWDMHTITEAVEDQVCGYFIQMISNEGYILASESMPVKMEYVIDVVISDIPGYEGEDVVTETHFPEQGFRVQVRPTIFYGDNTPIPGKKYTSMLFTNWDPEDEWIFDMTFRNPNYDYNDLDSGFNPDVIEPVEPIPINYLQIFMHILSVALFFIVIIGSLTFLILMVFMFTKK